MKDPEWAAVVENFFGAGTLHSFICSNDTDNKLLDALLQQRCHGNKPKIITSSMSGQVRERIFVKCLRFGFLVNLNLGSQRLES